MVDLSTRFCGIKLKNPTILASGILGVTRGCLERAIQNGAGAVTIKSLTRERRTGHRGPNIVKVEGGLLNAMGYCNMGLANARKEFVGLKKLGAPVIASVVAEDARGFAFMAEKVEDMEFSALEIVLSCPHTPGFGLLAGHGTPEATRKITSAVREATKKPVIVKLSPSVMNLGEIAKAAEDAGADAINMGNTLGPGMVVNVRAKKPVLSFKVGGMSGPVVKPITVRCVYDVYKAVDIPIIGTGGITTGLDAAEVMMAGASAVGVGTAVFYRGLDAFRKITKELEDFMKAEDYKKVKALVGLAHEGV